MEIQAAVAKISKFGSRISGDTLEIVERPNGGVSIVLADGRSSGHDAKAISSLVVRKVISLLADGVRDGAAARAASDYLFTVYEGKASVYLSILSADLQTNTLVITRNNQTPVFIANLDHIECVSGESQAIGTERNIKPSILEIPLQADSTIVMYTDGLGHAGETVGESLDICTTLLGLLDEQAPTAQHIADTTLNHAIRLDQGRPNDDMSIVVLRVVSTTTDHVRRMIVRFPVD
ncbi:MAG TPA: SpoIIE family protein phosphatase [Anaerolineaceae bacterium]|nr:SpoIIE family protein phosphatase [Anaerolineaceae bacterium]HOH18750.1 SpoIIE family protein phosphatase [Anaerolineaceae bacterium]